jgi:hypothetical protein
MKKMIAVALLAVSALTMSQIANAEPTSGSAPMNKVAPKYEKLKPFAQAPNAERFAKLKPYANAKRSAKLKPFVN